MALHTLTDDGQMGWQCPKCRIEHTTHISHEQVLYRPDSDMVALPPCECGLLLYLKVNFTDEELNMLAKGSEPIAERHKNLAKQMEAIGKTHGKKP